MQPIALVLAQVQDALRPLANAQQAQAMGAYMLNQFAFLGIRAPLRRQALRGLPRLKD
jgi:3-methyladenine DNA glycosylase AlkD